MVDLEVKVAVILVAVMVRLQKLIDQRTLHIPVLMVALVVVEHRLVPLASEEVVDPRQAEVKMVIQEIVQVGVLGMLHGMDQLAGLQVIEIAIQVIIMAKEVEELTVAMALDLVKIMAAAAVVPSVVLLVAVATDM